jgi:hypothetical protein
MDADLAKMIFPRAVCRERRSGIDRRQITYDLHIPERRLRKDRRSCTVWLSGIYFRMSPKQMIDPERRATFEGKNAKV